MQKLKTLKELFDEHGPCRAINRTTDGCFKMTDCKGQYAIGYDADGNCVAWLSRHCNWRLKPKEPKRLRPAVYISSLKAVFVTSELFESVETAKREMGVEIIRLATDDDLQNGILVNWE